MTERDFPLVSVVIPTYNRPETLRRSVESVLNQDYPNLEVIVVDDGSDQRADELLLSLVDHRVVHIRHDTNRGVSAARNTGIKAAKGSLVAFQDSDDEWLLGKLTRQVESLIAVGPEFVLCFCTKIVYGRDETYNRGSRRVACVPSPDSNFTSGYLFPELVKGNLVSTQTILVWKDSLESIGGFDERLKTSEEWFLSLKLALKGKFLFVDCPLVNTYVQRDSISLLGRHSLYSQIIVSNWLKRVGVPASEQSDRLAFIGQVLGRDGFFKRGFVFLGASLLSKPLNLRTWLRLFLFYYFFLSRRVMGRLKSGWFVS